MIIGGGFAGLRIAKKSISSSIFSTLLIDSKDYFEYTPSVPRAIIQPERSEAISVAFSTVIPAQNFMRGLVTEVMKDRVRNLPKKKVSD